MNEFFLRSRREEDLSEEHQRCTTGMSELRPAYDQLTIFRMIE